MRTAGKLAVLFFVYGKIELTGKSFYNTKNIKEQMFENGLQNEWNYDMLITEKKQTYVRNIKGGE